MMTKDQQIKALAKTICGSIEAQSYCKVAQALYEAGYRRVPEATRTLHVGSKHICSNCGELASMENYCSRCGARVIDKEN